ncbi:Glycerophosphoryl diester phosphodiesterase family-domain-containing protein [Cokeromyces recurvatus]|uniref:Glycerophosphoryl diester phosphodiesterase family-domain-containing protein n=1 Tax=Cokeromyces recurvatus TaxID=90255 RepID=UPI00221F7DD3|nr:Glycerophosphoryl diester phosphodiesterase family-domain-containing protein [Cokeromyces recurvatus]KAI7904329.1 Glycerophosphoryl diester phosphodiesterase family-domain-containing protein [Cokeromyces recurvatus]
MKFGKALIANQIPEWSKNYLSYKTLKRQIKTASTRLPAQEDVTAIFFHLDRELEKINTFFVYKQTLIHRRLWILREKYDACHDEEENDELVSALKEIKNQMNKLLWFAELNTKGFRKILKKLDKKLELETQNVYWETKVAVLPFTSLAQLRRELDQVSDWILNLINLAKKDEKISLYKGNNSSSSLKLARFTSKNEDISKAIIEDNPKKLALLLLKEEETRINDAILELSVENESIQCLKYLVSTLGLSLANNRDINERNLLHRTCMRETPKLIIVKTLLELEPSLNIQKDFTGRRPLHYAAEKNNAKLVKCLLQHAIDHHHYSLSVGFTNQQWQDRDGFNPFFFAIIHGSTDAIKEMIEIGQINDIDSLLISNSTSLPSSPSTVSSFSDKNSSVISSFEDLMISPSNGQFDSSLLSDSLPTANHSSLCYHYSYLSLSAVALACRLGNLSLLKLLIEKGASVNIADEDGETALSIAIQNNFVEGIKVLIKQGHVNINIAEKVNGWTPLMIAAIEGYKDIVEILLEANANKDMIDHNGWTASDHAVFRGFLDIGRLTSSPMNFNMIQTTHNNDNQAKSNTPTRSRSRSRSKSSVSTTKASRLYGHKYLTDLSIIIITLGSNDIRNPLCQKFIEFSEKFLSNSNEKPDDHPPRLSLSFSALNATGEFPIIIDLPSDLTSSTATTTSTSTSTTTTTTTTPHHFHPEPIILFTAAKPEEVTLRFDLIETFNESSTEGLLARGTSLLTGDSIFTKSKGYMGPTQKASLRGRQHVPLVQAKDLECIGTLGFEYFVITPFHHKKMRVGDRYTYYKSLETQVIGHRGSGMNRKGGSKLQVGENTVLSFVTAASLGAEYVEFDVQLTKDLIPVVYHDFTVAETGFDIPLNAITLEQFLNLRRSGHIKENHTGVSDQHGIVVSTTVKDSLPSLLSISPNDTNKPQLLHLSSSSNEVKSSKRTNRSHSFSSSSNNNSSRSSSSSNNNAIRNQFNDPFEFTRTFKMGKIKGNGPNTIQGPFTTLEETLKSVPKSVGFNIEVKYPMIDEAEQDELTSFQELNIYVDSILECVYDHVEENRHIIFSSFHPEICLALNLKQPNYPVFFLTDAGTLSVADIRCNSLREAVRFAKQADLLGIVAASEPILTNPRMVRVIQETGLLLFTYGILNNEVENAVAQKSYGVDAVIVDSVLPVRKGLRGDA